MISVIIPAYNEEKRIRQTVESIMTALLSSTKDFEILVINDGSRDRTEAVANGLKNKHIKIFSLSSNQGKGSAVKYGMQKAKGEYIVFMDADLPYPPEKILTACKMIEKGADAVFGMRVQTNHGKKYPWYRTILSKGFGIFVRTVIHIRQKDTQCGFKVFKKEVAKELFNKMTVTGWGFDVEIVFLSEKLNYKTERIPVELFHEEKESKIKIFSDAVKMMAEVLSIRKKYKKGIYEI